MSEEEKQNIIYYLTQYSRDEENRVYEAELCKNVEKLLCLYENIKLNNETLEILLKGTLYDMYNYYKELASQYQGNCVKKEDLKQILYPTSENPIDLEIQNSKMYKKLLELIGE